MGGIGVGGTAVGGTDVAVGAGTFVAVAGMAVAAGGFVAVAVTALDLLVAGAVAGVTAAVVVAVEDRPSIAVAASPAMAWGSVEHAARSKLSKNNAGRMRTIKRLHSRLRSEPRQLRRLKR